MGGGGECRGSKLNEHMIEILSLFRRQKEKGAVNLVLAWSFIQMFPQGFQRRRVEEEKEKHCGVARKYSREDSICGMNGYGKLADSDRRVN